MFFLVTKSYYDMKGMKPKEQCDHDKVGKEGGEPDNLPRGVEALVKHLVNITMIQA